MGRRRNEQPAARNRAVLRTQPRHSSARLCARLQDLDPALAAARADLAGRHEKRDHRPRLRPWHVEPAG
nr:hypothetical protein [Agrobacterium tumefaciens]